MHNSITLGSRVAIESQIRIDDNMLYRTDQNAYLKEFSEERLLFQDAKHVVVNGEFAEDESSILSTSNTRPGNPRPFL